MVLSRRVLLGSLPGGLLAGCAGAVEPSGTPPESRAGSTQPRTSPSPSPATALSLRIAVASDLHYGEKGTDYVRFADELIDAVNASHAATPLDLVVLNGDLAHSATALAPLRSRLRRLTPPILPVQGNHDGATEAQWRQLWGHGFDHAETVRGVRIVPVATSNPEGASLCTNRNLLAAQLRSAAGAPVIVAMHITPATWTRYGIDCPAITAMLGSDPNVLAVLNGHDHDEYGVKSRDGLPYLFDSHAGGHWGTSFRGFRELELFADGRIETRVTDGVTVHGSDSLPPRG